MPSSLVCCIFLIYVYASVCLWPFYIIRSRKICCTFERKTHPMHRGESVCPCCVALRGSNSSPSSSRPLTASSLNPMMNRKRLFSCHNSTGPGLDREPLGVAKVCRHLEQCSRLSCSCERIGELTSIWERTETVILPSSQVTGCSGLGTPDWEGRVHCKGFQGKHHLAATPGTFQKH